jgi:hypothetical protein
MPVSIELQDVIRTISVAGVKLLKFRFPRPTVDRLRDLAALVTYRGVLGSERLPLIGFIGCTGVGKSTLFNSLCGQPLSATGWRVHNTRGPVLCMPAAAFKDLEKWEKQHDRVFMPLMPRSDAVPGPEGGATIGAPDMLHMVCPQAMTTATENFCPVDLPDINSSPAVDEQLVALDVLPWLDIVIFMVDDETVYHRVFTRPVHMADELEQPRFCVMVNRGRDSIEPDHQDWRQIRTFFGVDTIHLFPDLNQKTSYSDEPAYTDFKNELAACRAATVSQPLVNMITDLAGTVYRENRRRRRQFEKLDHTIVQTVRDLLVRDTPLALHRLLPDETLHTLNHLGLKRFALSNLLYFFKSAVSASALKRSLKLSFGNHRDEVLAQLIHIDQQKLIRQVSERMDGYAQLLTSTVRRSPQFDFLKQLTADATLMTAAAGGNAAPGDHPPSFVNQLKTAADDFENKYRELLRSDSVSRVIRNDPLAALFLAGALVADVFVLPGFGSWLLVPTVIKYLPLGKFEKAKKKFQRAVQEVIRQQLLMEAARLQDLRLQTVLATDDPLLQALDICSGYGKDPSGEK